MLPCWSKHRHPSNNIPTRRNPTSQFFFLFFFFFLVGNILISYIIRTPTAPPLVLTPHLISDQIPFNLLQFSDSLFPQLAATVCSSPHSLNLEVIYKPFCLFLSFFLYSVITDREDLTSFSYGSLIL